MTDEQWSRIFQDLSEDILGRSGLKWDWRWIDEDSLPEISEAWRSIVEKNL